MEEVKEIINEETGEIITQEDSTDVTIQPHNPNMDMMEKIANDEQTFQDIKLLTSTKVTDQLKVFLVSQARNELSRVIKLTNFLDKIENGYLNKIDKLMKDDEISLKQYGEIVETITTLLGRSNSIISNILKDDSLTTILNTTIYTNTDTNGGQGVSVVSQLKDPQSREKVRNVINQILYKTENYAEEQPNEVVIDSAEGIENGNNTDS